MKKIIVALALMSAFSALSLSDKPRSVYSKANPVAVSKVDSAMKSSEAVSGDDEAFADADDVVMEDSAECSDTGVVHTTYRNPDVAERIVGRVLDSKAVVVGIVFALCFCILPFIFILVVVILVYKSRRRKYDVMEKAIEKGMPMPEQLVKTEGQSDEYLWRKGIKNVFLGLGLTAFFWIFGMEPLHAIGLLMLFYGLGQMAISYASANDLLHRNKKSGDDFIINE